MGQVVRSTALLSNGRKKKEWGGLFCTSATIFQSRGCPLVSALTPCSAGALFVLEPHEAQDKNKAPCLLCGPSTSPRSSDNTQSVLLTLASFS